MNCFEIRDPEIDTAEIGRSIAERSEQRRRYAREQAINFEQLVQPAVSDEAGDEAIRWTLSLMEARQAAILVEPYAISANQGGMGRLVSWLKMQAHNLVIYYVNKLGQKQILFNESATWAIALQQARFEKLQTQVSALEQEIQRLEARLATQRMHE
jgi:hypothetical protein